MASARRRGVIERYSAAISRRELELFLPVARDLLAVASEISRKHFGRGVTHWAKEDGSQVTDVDQQSELLMRELIRSQFPDHSVIGEEYGTDWGKSNYTWVLDPIDGTEAFISNAYLFGTLVAVLRDGRPILGCLSHPMTGHLLVGTMQSTTFDGLPVRVKKGVTLSQATLLCTSHFDVQRHGMDVAQRFEKLAQSARIYRGWGDCHGYFQLATGGAHVMLDPDLSFTDIPALVPIIEGAGGRITSWTGGDPMKADSLIATNAELHEAMLTALS